MTFLRKIGLSFRYGSGYFVVAGLVSLCAFVIVGINSGGERRIAELYMILNSDAEFCVLDEPFSNIAPIYDEKIRSMIQEQKANKGIIITDHVYEEILRVADDLFLLRDGFTYQIHSRDDLVRLGYILS